MTDVEQCVLSERRGAVLIVTLNRPDRRNGITTEMCRQLYDVLLPVPASDARVVVLRGAGNDFSVGADLTGSGSTELPSFEQLGPTYHASHPAAHHAAGDDRRHRRWVRRCRARVGVRL